ncbi:hypothetical protein bcgnr5369_58980 [Bacillus cereus]
MFLSLKVFFTHIKEKQRGCLQKVVFSDLLRQPLSNNLELIEV